MSSVFVEELEFTTADVTDSSFDVAVSMNLRPMLVSLILRFEGLLAQLAVASVLTPADLLVNLLLVAVERLL